MIPLFLVVGLLSFQEQAPGVQLLSAAKVFTASEAGIIDHGLVAVRDGKVEQVWDIPGRGCTQ